MGSETGAKWLMLILLYFTIMTVVVTLISDISPSTTVINTTGGYDLSTNTTGVYCSLPRTTYEYTFDDGVKSLTATLSDDFSDESYTRSGNTWISNIECKYSSGQLGETQCLALEGCTWEEDNPWWFFGITGDFSCEGTFNYTWVNESDIITLWGFGDYIYYDDGLEYFPIQGICGYEPVINNATRCAQMSCSWGNTIEDIELFNANAIEVNTNMITKIWGVVKDMVTFSFDFGFENVTANFILNFLIFWLPLIGLGLAIYVMIRS